MGNYGIRLRVVLPVAAVVAVSALLARPHGVSGCGMGHTAFTDTLIVDSASADTVVAGGDSTMVASGKKKKKREKKEKRDLLETVAMSNPLTAVVYVGVKANKIRKQIINDYMSRMRDSLSVVDGAATELVADSAVRLSPACADSIAASAFSSRHRLPQPDATPRNDSTAVCRACKGGKRRFVIKQGEGRFEDCAACGGTGQAAARGGND